MLYVLCVCAVCAQLLHHVPLFATAWAVARQAPLSMGFLRQEYWSGLPFPPPEDLPDPGIKPRSPALQVDSLPAEPQGKPFVHESEVKLLSPVQLFGIPWTVVYQASLSMGFFRQEYWSGLPFPFTPDPGTEPGSLMSPALQSDSLLSEPSGKPQ